MKSSKPHTQLVLHMALEIPCVASGQVFGFILGHDTLHSVKIKLHACNAEFEMLPGYHGDPRLPRVRLLAYPPIDQYGHTRHAGLCFGTDGRLYRVHATWSDPGTLYPNLKDALRRTMTADTPASFGLIHPDCFEIGAIRLRLHSNTVGYGRERTTGLIGVHTPVLSAIKILQQTIDAERSVSRDTPARSK